MPTPKTINISLPVDVEKEIQKATKVNQMTVSDLIREAFRQYQAQKNITAFTIEGRKAIGIQRLDQSWIL